MTNKNKFINENNVRMTKQLFIEYDHISDNDNAVYTLSRVDKTVNGKTYPSLYQLYMSEADITEARFVQKYLYDWEQWERLTTTSVLADEIELWRKDLRQRLAGELVDRLVKDAFDTKSRSSTSSAKYLLDNIVKADRKQTNKGRPNKGSRNNAGLVSIDADVAADLERVSRVRKTGTDE